MTWTQAVCDDRFQQMNPGVTPHRIRNLDDEDKDTCCFCGRPADIYVRIDPTTVPYPREG